MGQMEDKLDRRKHTNERHEYTIAPRISFRGCLIVVGLIVTSIGVGSAG